MNEIGKGAAALRLEGIGRSFRQGREQLDILKNCSLAIRPGEIVALVGPSGSGKSTLLHIAGLLEKPGEGRIWIGGEEASDANDDKRTELRRRFLGFVYQYHHLLPEFSAIENIVLPQMVAGVAKSKAREEGLRLLAKMGLDKRAEHRPGQLSGGEQQRVAIARALANEPHLLLADEPTGNLDPHTADGVFEELMRLVRDANLAALIATHNPELAKRMGRVITLRDGVLVDV